MVQCFRCLKFGHFIKECKGSAVCRKCGSSKHIAKDCDHDGEKCVNCSIKVAAGAQVNVRHNSTDNRCPSRLDRINGLKFFLVEKPEK